MRSVVALRALPVMLRIGFAEAVAYRAEFLIWFLSTTMPLIMLALWSAVAHEAPVGRFGQAEFTAYFLVTFVVRQLVGSWASWQLNWEIRQGTLSLRLLRPVHTMLAYAVENIGAIPLRAAICLPIVVIGLIVVGADPLPRDPAMWALVLAALAGGWLITFFASFAIGSLAFYFDSSLKVMDVWLTLFLVFSGYIAPVELFPPAMRTAAEWMPFRYQIGLPVELLTSAHAFGPGLALVARQWAWVTGLALTAILLWRGGVRRFAAYGG